MKFSEKMVFQMERAEQKRKDELEQLEGMARALGCDLVYGLVPWERSLEDRRWSWWSRSVEEEVYGAASQQVSELASRRG